MSKSSIISVLWMMYQDKVIDSPTLTHYLHSYGLHLEKVTPEEIEVSEVDKPETVYNLTSYEVRNHQES